MSGRSGSRPKLRMITYMCPGIPIELFETLRDYLEEVLDVHGTIIYESRWSGPVRERGPDPFTQNDVDMGFMCASLFLRLMIECNPHVELCPTGVVYRHPNNPDNQPIYFSDVIIHSDNSKKYQEFDDLKGRKWAFNEPGSLSGNLMALAELKKMGTNASFFGNVLRSGSNLNSIKMVLDKRVDGASVDSNVLQSYLLEHPSHRSQLSILTSMGPIPIYPIVFNTRMPEKTKEAIVEALLSMNKKPVWKKRLDSFQIQGYMPIDISLYDLEKNIQDLVKNLSVNTTYY